jgi:hypothetical protein
MGANGGTTARSVSGDSLTCAEAKKRAVTCENYAP